MMVVVKLFRVCPTSSGVAAQLEHLRCCLEMLGAHYYQSAIARVTIYIFGRQWLLGSVLL